MFGGRKSINSNYSTSGSASGQIVVRRHRPDYQIALFMGLLMLLGLIIIYAIGPQRANVLNNAYGYDYSDSYFFIKQICSLGISLAVFTVVAIIPYEWFEKNSGKILLFGFGACLLLAIASWLHLNIAQQTLGASRWFSLGNFGSLQPAEILKFAILVYMAGFLGAKASKGQLNNFNETLLPTLIVSALALLFIVVVQKDLGTGASLIGIIASMLFVAGINNKNIFIATIIILLAGSLFIVSASHRMDRILTFIKGDSTSSVEDPSSYHIEHAKLAIGTGGLFGVGIGNSVQATGYLPEAINDSVFAIMGETFGFIGLITVLSIFVALLMRLLKVMDHLVDIRLKLLVAGVFGWFGTHVILNIGSMIGVLPLTGITLPLLSFGGTSMLFITAALGLVFQLSRYTVHSSRLKEAYNENIGSRRGIGWSRYSGRGGYSRN